MPVWQAIIPELVPRDELPSALTLNSLGVNSARAVGPVLGGFIVAAAGPAIVFLLNGVSFIGVILTVYRWCRPSLKSVLPAERVIGAMRAGIRYVRYSPALRGVLIRSGTFILFGSVLWALLPLLIRLRFERGAAWYGILLGFFGIGAIAGAISLPHLRERMSINKITAAATVLFACAMIMIGVIQTFYALLPVMIIAGATWLSLLCSLMQVSKQRCLRGCGDAGWPYPILSSLEDRQSAVRYGEKWLLWRVSQSH